MAWLAYSLHAFFVFSAMSYSKSSHSVHKQLSEELVSARLSPAAVWRRPQISCETAELSRLTSSPDSLAELNSSAATVNSTPAANVGSRMLKEHLQTCSLDEPSNSLKPAEDSVALSTNSSSQMYAFIYVA